MTSMGSMGYLIEMELDLCLYLVSIISSVSETAGSWSCCWGRSTGLTTPTVSTLTRDPRNCSKHQQEISLIVTRKGFRGRTFFCWRIQSMWPGLTSPCWRLICSAWKWEEKIPTFYFYFSTQFLFCQPGSSWQVFYLEVYYEFWKVSQGESITTWFIFL